MESIPSSGAALVSRGMPRKRVPKSPDDDGIGYWTVHPIAFAAMQHPHPIETDRKTSTSPSLFQHWDNLATVLKLKPMHMEYSSDWRDQVHTRQRREHVRVDRGPQSASERMT